MLPLKPQDKSVIPILKLSIMMQRGFFNYGFHTVIVDSGDARAMTENPDKFPAASL